MTIPIDAQAITAFALAMVRATAFIVVVPPFNTRVIPAAVKGIVAAAFALASVPMIVDQQIPYDTKGFVVALLSQAITGLAMGLLVGLLFHALQTAGALVDLAAGFSLAAIYDPLSESQNPLFGRTYQLVGITLLFATNAHLLIVSGFLRSFEVIPVGGFSAVQVSGALTRHLGNFLVAALEIAGPVLACLFLTELVLGLLSRAAPALNIFALAFPVRIVVTLVAAAVALPLLLPSLTNLVDAGIRASLGGG